MKNSKAQPRKKRPHQLEMLLDMPQIENSAQLEHTWSDEVGSYKLYVTEDNVRVEIKESTEGRVPFTKGFHVWEILWPIHQRGEHVVIGVATIDVSIGKLHYDKLIEGSNKCWGWDVGRKRLCHARGIGRQYPALSRRNETFKINEKILIILDMDKGTLSFDVDDEYLGVAFRGLKGKQLFPIISAGWGDCQFSLKYIGGLHFEKTKLSDLCRKVIRESIGQEDLENKITTLDLPDTLKNYLM